MKKILLIGIVGVVIVIVILLVIIGVVYIDYNNNKNARLIAVPVANSEIEEGLIIRGDMVTIKEVLEKEINENTYKILDDVIGKKSTKKIERSQYFTTKNIK